MKTKLSRIEATREEATRAEVNQAGATRVGTIGSLAIEVSTTRIFFSAPPKKNTTLRHW